MNDHDMLVKLATQMDEVHKVVMGNGKPGLLADVTRLNTKVAFIQWAGALGTATILGALVKVILA